MENTARPEQWLSKKMYSNPSLYDLLFNLMYFPRPERRYRWFPRLPGKTLNVGCGTGTCTNYLAGLCEELYNFDINGRFLQFGLRERGRRITRPVVADANRMPYQDEAFDRVFVPDVLHHLYDHPANQRHRHFLQARTPQFQGHESIDLRAGEAGERGV